MTISCLFLALSNAGTGWVRIGTVPFSMYCTFYCIGSLGARKSRPEAIDGHVVREKVEPHASLALHRVKGHTLQRIRRRRDLTVVTCRPRYRSNCLEIGQKVYDTW